MFFSQLLTSSNAECLLKVPQSPWDQVAILFYTNLHDENTQSIKGISSSIIFVRRWQNIKNKTCNKQAGCFWSVGKKSRMYVSIKLTVPGQFKEHKGLPLLPFSMKKNMCFCIASNLYKPYP